MSTTAIRLKKLGWAWYILAVVALGLLTLVVIFDPIQTFLKIEKLQQLEEEDKKLSEDISHLKNEKKEFEQMIIIARKDLKEKYHVPDSMVSAMGKEMAHWVEKANEAESKIANLEQNRKETQSNQLSIFSTFKMMKRDLGIDRPIVLIVSCIFLTIVSFICALLLFISFAVYLLSNDEGRAARAQLVVKRTLGFFITSGGAVAGTLSFLAN